MTLNNSEVDECGIRDNAPPSYQNLLRQENNRANTFLSNNSSALQSRESCVLCQCCHSQFHQKMAQSRSTVKSLDRISHVIETNLLSSQSQAACNWFFVLLLIACYILVYWLHVQKTISRQEYKSFLSNFNISEDVKQILLDHVKRT